MRLNDSNHWMEGMTDHRRIVIGMVGTFTSLDYERMTGNVQTHHFCGQECAMKWVGIRIGELK